MVLQLTDGDAGNDGNGDKIDLSAFDIDDSDLAGLLSERGRQRRRQPGRAMAAAGLPFEDVSLDELMQGTCDGEQGSNPYTM